MIEKLKKIGRVISRRRVDYNNNEVAGILFGGMAGVPLMIEASFAAGLLTSGILVPTLYCAIYAYGKLSKQGVVAKKAQAADQETVGDEWSGVNLECTQKCINSLTEKFKNASQIPPNVEVKIQAYLQDAAEFAAQVRVFKNGKEQDEMIFVREVFNAHGQSTQIAVGAVKTEMGLMAQQSAAPAAPVPPAPAQQGIKVLKPLQYTKKPQKQAAL